MATPENHAPRTAERIATLLVETNAAPWSLAVAHSAAIEAHWQRRKTGNPAFFNGHVFVLQTVECQSHADRTQSVRAQFSLETFASFLYWRDHPALAAQGLDGFGSALVCSREGFCLLGLQAPATLNAGQVLIPGGFLDARDARPDGRIDIDAAIARELEEETGLSAKTLERDAGYIMTRIGRMCGFTIVYRSPMPAADLRARMLEGITQTCEQELADVVVITGPSDLDSYNVPEHTRLTLDLALRSRH